MADFSSNRIAVLLMTKPQVSILGVGMCGYKHHHMVAYPKRSAATWAKSSLHFAATLLETTLNGMSRARKPFFRVIVGKQILYSGKVGVEIN
jgi:hypothetical protein